MPEHFAAALSISCLEVNLFYLLVKLFASGACPMWRTTKKGAYAIKTQIKEMLEGIEREEGVSVLYAVESGSRAWGFDSEDSDYDVRFIYLRPARDYARITPFRDVIERPLTSNLDVSGWDIVKALRLFQKSNPPLIEWLFSPTIYREEGDFARELRALAQDRASVLRMAHHYLSMAQRTRSEYLEGRERVQNKKYLYALRPIGALRWLERNQTLPPTSFLETLEGIALPQAVQDAVLALIAKKRAGTELEGESPSPLLNAFIAEEMARLQEWTQGLPDVAMDERPLNALLWGLLGVS